MFPSQSANVGPASFASGPGSGASDRSTAASGSDGSAGAGRTCTASPRLAATWRASSTMLSSRGPAISVIVGPSNEGAVAIAASSSATARAATICVRMSSM